MLRNVKRAQNEKQTAIHEMMKNVENIMEENNRYNSEINNLNDELKATRVLFEDLKIEKENIVQKMGKDLKECEFNGKRTVENLRDEHQSLIESITKEHSSIVDDLQRSKVEAIELVKKQHVKRMSDVLTANEEEHKKELEERDNKIKILSQKEELMKASYSEKVNVHNVYCRTI